MPNESRPAKDRDSKGPLPEPGEFYQDGPYLVFTAAYHLRRGWCCESGCRHCPYGFVKPVEPASTEGAV